MVWSPRVCVRFVSAYHSTRQRQSRCKHSLMRAYVESMVIFDGKHRRRCQCPAAEKVFLSEIRLFGHLIASTLTFVECSKLFHSFFLSRLRRYTFGKLFFNACQWPLMAMLSFGGRFFFSSHTYTHTNTIIKSIASSGNKFIVCKQRAKPHIKWKSTFSLLLFACPSSITTSTQR